jgi:hypothetical protein
MEPRGSPRRKRLRIICDALDPSGIKDLIEARSERIPETGCWIWTGPLRGNGYGGFGKKDYAHRAAYRAYHGKIPDGLQVLHRCDVPLCVNPAHLFAGTQKQNVHDARIKGRLVGNTLIGAAHGATRLTWDDVAGIRALSRAGVTKAWIARKFGISHSQASRIVANRSWCLPA